MVALETWRQTYKGWCDHACSQKRRLSPLSFFFVLPEADAVNTYSSEQVEVKKRTTIKKMEKNKLHAVLRTFLESIQVSIPDTTRVTIDTNQNKDLLEGMMENWKNSSATPITHVTFSYFDMIVVDDLGCVFKYYPFFDVALTLQNNLRQSINSGVIMVQGTLESLSRGKLLLKEVDMH